MYIAFTETMFMLGTWSLRKTNDPYYQKMETRLNIYDDNRAVLCSNQMDKFTAKTVKNIGSFHNIEEGKAMISYSTMEEYTYSFLGIEIPKSLYKEVHYPRVRKMIKYEIRYQSLLIQSKKYYYIFDLMRSDEIINKPYVETKWSTFLFIQLIAFLLNEELQNIFDKLK